MLRQVLHRVCTHCHAPFETRDPQQERCKARACRLLVQRERSRAFRAAERIAERRDTDAAPALKVACDALEAQLTPENRAEWRSIIERFGWPRTPGYTNLADLARRCVLAKRFKQ